MSDRFRFRAWNEKERKFILDHNYPIGSDYFLALDTEGKLLKIGMGDLNAERQFSWGNIEEYQGFLEQCTGLKDKHGRLIYEGDVIKIDSSTINVNETEALVFWDACEASFNLQWLPKGSGAQAIKRIKKLAKHGLGDTRWWEVEIIGNIHEHGGLLNEN